MNQTIDLAGMKNAIGISVTLRQWGNRRKADMGSVKTDADKSRLKLSKNLIVASEYDEISSFLGAVRSWVEANTMPSFFKTGFYLTKASGVEPIEKYLKKARELELPMLVANLKEVYPRKIEEARKALDDQFDINDYPPAESLDSLFAIEHNWLAFTVPEGLPDELKQAEAAKLESQFKDAGEQITLALREGFQQLVGNLSDKLKVGPDGKQKVFRDTLVGNLLDFIKTFNNRNLLNDRELADLVERAKSVIANVKTPEELRKNLDLRGRMAEQFAELNNVVTGMIVNKPVRKLDLQD